MASFIETKRHINKPTQTYTCELFCQGSDWVVLRYVSEAEWYIGNTHLPVGTSTLACYEQGADCVLWRMIDPKGHLIGHLFHICADIDIQPSAVDYLDLLLDVWVDAQDALVILDEDELADCVYHDKLTESQAHEIETFARDIARDRQAWITSLDKKLK
jgi:hypothetical protein